MPVSNPRVTTVQSDGLAALLAQSDTASGKAAARFFKSVGTEAQLKSLYDLENRWRGCDESWFLPDSRSRFKRCTFVASTARASVGF